MTDQNLCPVCSAVMLDIKPWLARCPDCQFWRSSLEPDGGRGVAGLEGLRRDNFTSLLRHLMPLMADRTGLRLLEVGSAQGLFLEAAAAAGFVVHGIEPSPDMKDEGTGVVDRGFFPQDLSDRRPYDVIVFNDVFEHFADPVRTIRQVEGLLAPMGHVVINLPSSSGILYRIAQLLDTAGLHGPFERLWQIGLPSPHMTYFNESNLTALVNRYTGLRLRTNFTLPSMSRKGLGQRVFSTSKGLGGAVQFAALWIMSFVMAHLPADIIVMIYRKSS